MKLPMINHGAGPPNMDEPSGRGTKMASSRRRKGVWRVTPCPAAVLATVATRNRWQLILAMVTCFIVGTIAYNEGSSAAPGLNLLGTVPASSPSWPDFLLSQNSTGGTLKLKHIVQGQTDVRAAGEKPHARSLWAHSVGPTDHLGPLEAKWNELRQTSTLFEFNLDGKGSLHYKPRAGKKARNGADSSTLRLDTHLGLEALAKITGFSSNLAPKELRASSTEDLLLSSPHASNPVTKAVDVGAIGSDLPAALSQGQLLSTDSGFSHLAPDAFAQPVKAAPDATSTAHLRTDSGLTQQAATESVMSEAWRLSKMTRFATMAPSTGVDQMAAKTRATSILLKVLGSAPQTRRASKEPPYRMGFITRPAVPASITGAPTLHNLTRGTNFPVSRSPLEGTSSGPADLITSRWPGSSPLSSDVVAHKAVEPGWLSTVPGTQPSLTPAPPSGESYLDTSSHVPMPSQVHGPSERSVPQVTQHLLPASMPQSTSLLPATVSMGRLPSAKQTASILATALLHLGDLSHITEHPPCGTVAVPNTLAGPSGGGETTAAVTPTVSKSAGWPMLPTPGNTTAQPQPSSGAPASPTSSVAVSSGLPLQSAVGTEPLTALSGHRGTRALTPSVPKLGQLLVPTTSLVGLSDVLGDLDMPTSLVLEVTSPEHAFLSGVLPTLVTGSDTFTDSTQLIEAVTEAPTSVAAGIGHSAATHPFDHLKLDEEMTSTSSTERSLPPAQLGHKLQKHTPEMARAGSSTGWPGWASSDLYKAGEQKGSPRPAGTQSLTNLTIPPSRESMRGAPGLGEMPVAGTIQALTDSTIMTGAKPTNGFLVEGIAAYSPYHILPVNKHTRSQPSTSVCCPETAPSVSGASTAVTIPKTTLYRASAKTVSSSAMEQSAAVAEMPAGSSELLLGASGDAPTMKSLPHSSSAKPQAQLARKHFSLHRPGARRVLSTPAASVSSHSTTSLPTVIDVLPGSKVHTSPQNETSPVSNDTSAVMVTELTVTQSMPLYLSTSGEELLADSMPTGMAHAPVLITKAGVPITSTTATSSKWKSTSTPGDHKGPDTSAKAVNFSRLVSAESPSRAMAPALGLTSTSTAVSRATVVLNRTATPLPSPPTWSTTALLASTYVSQSAGPQAPILQPTTEGKPSVLIPLHDAIRTPATTKTVLLTRARTLATPGLQLPTVKPTRLTPSNKTTVPTLHIPHTSALSTHLLLTSQHGSTAKTDLHVLTTLRAARKNLTTAAVTAKQVATIKISHMSMQTLPTSKVPTLSFLPGQEIGSASGSTSPALQLPVHILPLQFHLNRIAYKQLLRNKSSESYRKLEKEVVLTLNKMLSSYKNFLKANILQFLNGSLIVESEVLFQGDVPAPTNSDLIRTVVTEVGKEVDTFFDWRVDVQSIRSNGFSLENLEPEKLLVSFTVLRLGSIAAFNGVGSQDPLDKLTYVVVQSLGALYRVKNFFISKLRDIQGNLEISGEAYIDTPTHADVSQVLQALRSLVNYSVDLTTLSVDDSRLGLQIFPISFLVVNRVVDERVLDHSSVEHQNLTRDLANVLMHVLKKYEGLLQVVIRDILSGSLICQGDVVFQPPGPASTDVLQTLLRSVGPGDMLAGSGFQVDPYSFVVADDKLETPFVYPSFPGYGVAIVMCGLVIITVLLVTLLHLNSGIFGWHGKAIIQGGRDPEAGTQTFELDNQGFCSTVEEADDRGSCSPMKLSPRE